MTGKCCIDVQKEILEQRLSGRTNHYMSSEMLDSQIAAFEPITPAESVITIDGSGSIDDVMSKLISTAIQHFPNLHKPWWKRSID
jgi:gluconate kinase